MTDAEILMRFRDEVRPHVGAWLKATTPVPAAITAAYKEAHKALTARHGAAMSKSLLEATFADVLMDAKAT